MQSPFVPPPRPQCVNAGSVLWGITVQSESKFSVKIFFLNMKFNKNWGMSKNNSAPPSQCYDANDLPFKTIGLLPLNVMTPMTYHLKQ